MKKISDVLKDFETSKEPFAEHQISTAINAFIKDKNKSDIPVEWLAEALAFDFHPKHEDTASNWGTYYGPQFVGTKDDGTPVEWPNITKVSPEIIDLWVKRASEATNPILKVRYADLIWDFSKIVTGTSPEYTIAHILIDNTIEIADNDCHKYEVSVIKMLGRALSIALSINDPKAVERLRDTIVAYEDKISIDSKPGLWGFSFDLLIDHKKIPIPQKLREKIIQDLEARLERLSDIQDNANPNPWAAERAALCLAAYYRKKNAQNDLKRVLLTLGNAFEAAGQTATSLQAYAWLQRVHSLYLDHSLRDEAERLSMTLRAIGEKVRDDVVPISSQVTVKDDEMKRYVEAVLGEDLESSLIRIARKYVPIKSQVEEQLKDIAEVAPLQYLIPKQIGDRQGRVVAVVGPLETDPEGNIVHLAAQNMQISGLFIRRIMSQLVARFDVAPQKIASFLYQSPLFEEDKRAIIDAGLTAYLENNHVVACHLLMPQIEAAVRRLIELAGGAVLKPRRGGGFHLRTLDELFRDPILVAVFGEDTALYLRILLTDQRGWNLRNDVCHGLMTASSFQETISDRLFHVLLCLALVRENRNEGQQDFAKSPANSRD